MKKSENKKIVIISRESNEKTLDVAMLEEELGRKGARVKVLSKLLTKEKSVGNAIGYIGHVIRQEAEILNADAVVLDTYCIPASMLPHRKDTKVIQMWHALGAVKKFGWQTVGKPDGTSEKTAKMMRMHSGYDYVICASGATAGHFAEAFRVGRDKIVRLGLPRIDYIRKVTHGEEAERARERIMARYPALRDSGVGEESEKPNAAETAQIREKTKKKTVLYAPTFRRGAAPDVAGLADALDPSRYNILVKLHPLYGGGGRVFRDNIIYDDEFSTYELLAAADAVVSDYSSLVIEASLADKPLYLYIYDAAEYEESTGLNMDFSKETIGRYAFHEAAALSGLLEEPYDYGALREFGKKYIEVSGAWEDSSDASMQNSCTCELADFILEHAAENKE